MKALSPIALFVYNRLDNTQATVEHLLANPLASDSILYVFSDGGKDDASWKKVQEVRDYLHTIKGFKEIHIIERPENYYLERNIIEGIEEVLNHHETIIVLEDDICTSPVFLEYINGALQKYADHPQVMHIAGFTNLDIPEMGDTYFTHHMSGWGWATWKNKWKYFTHYTTKEEALQLRALDQYLFDGGFPEIIGSDNNRKYTLSLLNAIINKDICQRYKVRHKQTLSDIANGLLDFFCQEVSYAQIAKTYQLNSIHTAKNYFSYLVNAYLLCSLPKYTFKSRERQQMRKIYAIDPAFITNHEVVLQPDNYGWRLENVIAIELLRRIDSSYQQLFYLRQNKSYEVDFVVVEQSKIKELIQVTYDFTSPTTKLYNREVGGLVKGAKQTGCRQLTLIMMNGESRDIEVEGYTIKCIRAIDWLLNRE